MHLEQKRNFAHRAIGLPVATLANLATQPITVDYIALALCPPTKGTAYLN